MIRRLLVYTAIGTILMLLFQFFGWLKATLFVVVLGTGFLSTILSAIAAAMLVGIILYFLAIGGAKLLFARPYDSRTKFFISRITYIIYALLGGMIGLWLVTLIPVVLTPNGNIVTLFIEGLVFNIIMLGIIGPPST
jgi:hypothetical protein